MSRQGLSYREVAQAADQLLKEKNTVPTVEALRTALVTTASTTTLVKHLNAWKEERITASLESETGMAIPSEKVAKHFESLWADLNNQRETEINREREEATHTIKLLENQLSTYLQEISSLQQEKQLLQEKCNEYQLQERKTKLMLQDREQQLNSMKEKLAQTESLIPALQYETQKRIDGVVKQKEEIIYQLKAENETLKGCYEKSLSTLREEILQINQEAKKSKDQALIKIESLEKAISKSDEVLETLMQEEFRRAAIAEKEHYSQISKKIETISDSVAEKQIHLKDIMMKGTEILLIEMGEGLEKRLNEKILELASKFEKANEHE